MTTAEQPHLKVERIVCKRFQDGPNQFPDHASGNSLAESLAEARASRKPETGLN
jgi:hypothetical protein